MWYQINLYKLAVSLLPTFLRKPVLSGFVKVCILPLQNMYERWREDREQDLYKLSHTGQVCSLEKSLNDRFDNQQRRIYIMDGNQYTRLYIYTTAELHPVFLTQSVYIYHRDDYEDTSVDFIVVVPPEVWTPQNYAIRSHINFYKQDVKQFKIIHL